MLLLVATKKTQGQRSNDFCWTMDGETVCFPSVCDRDGCDPDGPCGCNRAMTGVATRKATTTVEVRNIDYTVDKAVQVVYDSYFGAGMPISREEAEEEVGELHRIAEIFGEGAVLEFRNGEFTRRN